MNIQKIPHIGLFSPMNIKLLGNYFPTQKEEFEATGDDLAPAVDTLIAELLRRKVRLSLFTLSRKISSSQVFHGDGISLYVAPCRRYAKLLIMDHYFFEMRELRRLLAAASPRPDVLHAQWSYEFGLAILNAEQPKVITVRDWAAKVLMYQKDFFRLGRWILNWRVLKSRGVSFLANSDYIREELEKHYGIKAKAVYNPIGNNFFDFPRLCSRPETGVFVTIGASGKLKNLSTLLDAFQQLRKESPEIRLRVIGVTPNDPAVEMWYQKYPLDGVAFLGKIDHSAVIKELDEADILVHPSLEESFGNAVVEAMARKVPVIGGANSGAIPWILDHGNAGILCNVLDPLELSAQMKRLLQTPRLREQYAETGYERCREFFSVSKVAEQHLEFYSSLMKMNMDGAHEQ